MKSFLAADAPDLQATRDFSHVIAQTEPFTSLYKNNMLEASSDMEHGVRNDEEVLAHVLKHWWALREHSPIYKILLEDVDLFFANKGLILARLRVLPVHLNSKATLHGTVSACLTDWAGGLAIASTGLEKTGVSTDIHTTYISTAKEGDLLEIEGTTTKVGGTLAFTTIKIEKVIGGTREPVAMGTHTKYVAVRKPQQ